MNSRHRHAYRTLGQRYVLDRLLGRGGSALVFLAEDTKLHRLVAIKILREELMASHAADRFLLETTSAARFHHPNLLPLLDSADHGEVAYYAMPYVHGSTLSQILRQPRLVPVTGTDGQGAMACEWHGS